MFFKFRAIHQNGFWKIRTYSSPSKEISPQLVGVLTMTQLQWTCFKYRLTMNTLGASESTVEIYEEKGN